MTSTEILPIMVTGLLFLFTFISGAFLSHLIKRGKVFLLTVHKLTSILTVISTGVTIYHLVSIR